jgi:hypothetical protein
LYSSHSCITECHAINGIKGEIPNVTCHEYKVVTLGISSVLLVDVYCKSREICKLHVSFCFTAVDGKAPLATGEDDDDEVPGTNLHL